MKVQILFTALATFTTTVSKCEKAPSYEKCKPYNIIGNYVESNSTLRVTIGEDTVYDKDRKICETIEKIDDYKHVSKVEKPSDNYFVYTIDTSYLMWLASYHFVLTFYDTGYVTVSNYSGDEAYHYKFDELDGKELYNTAHNFITDYKAEQERIRKEEEERQKDMAKIKEEIMADLETVDIDSVLETVSEMDKFPFWFHVGSAYLGESDVHNYYEFDDDGSIIEILKNTKFTESKAKYTSSVQFNEMGFEYELKERGIEVIVSIYEPTQLLEISATKLDSKYRRVFSKEVCYSLDRESATNLFNKGLEFVDKVSSEND